MFSAKKKNPEFASNFEQQLDKWDRCSVETHSVDAYIIISSFYKQTQTVAAVLFGVLGLH